MRCDDLTRELASPTGTLSRADIAGHLATCPGCAEWSDRAARFDRIWDATRPSKPSPDAMDALWAGVSSALDERQAVPAGPKLRFEAPARRRRRVVAAFALAQAAAILAAALFLFRRESVVEPQPPPRVAIAPMTPVATTVAVTVDVDETAFVRIGKDNEYRVDFRDDAPLFASSSMPDATPHDIFNAWESMVSR